MGELVMYTNLTEVYQKLAEDDVRRFLAQPVKFAGSKKKLLKFYIKKRKQLFDKDKIFRETCLNICKHGPSVALRKSILKRQFEV